MATQAPVRKVDFPLTQQEWKLVEELRRHPFAEITIEMKAGQPHRIVRGIESVML